MEVENVLQYLFTYSFFPSFQSFLFMQFLICVSFFHTSNVSPLFRLKESLFVSITVSARLCVSLSLLVL
jgi:hypothetical protein